MPGELTCPILSQGPKSRSSFIITIPSDPSVRRTSVYSQGSPGLSRSTTFYFAYFTFCSLWLKTIILLLCLTNITQQVS